MCMVGWREVGAIKVRVPSGGDSAYRFLPISTAPPRSGVSMRNLERIVAERMRHQRDEENYTIA